MGLGGVMGKPREKKKEVIKVKKKTTSVTLFWSNKCFLLLELHFEAKHFEALCNFLSNYF